MALDNMDAYDHTVKFAEQDKTVYMQTLKKMAVTLDLFEKSLYSAKDKIEQLEKELSEASKRIGERIAEAVHDMQKLVYKKEDPDRPTWSKIQQKPVECLERTVKAMKRASDGKGAGESALNCADCQALKAKLDDLEKTLETQQKEIDKLLADKKDLLEDRKRDKDEMERLNEKMAKLRVENATENPKKRNK
ncbi:hypothetical protein AAVH_39994 [Aphelenchoides avenae]|nr:hypothetical protein AAVH_39994 [Aphelenchus avenae]